MKPLKLIYEKHHSHNGEVDEAQLSVILHTAQHLIVEAPAGYGKTKTMISKIAYLILSGQIPNTKRILALTFSVNAAYKIRREILDQVKNIVEDKEGLRLIESHVDASNYHGFCRRILSRYGYLLAPSFANISQFKNVDDGRQDELNILPFPINVNDKQFLSQFAKDLKSVGKPGVSAEGIIKRLTENKKYYLELLLRDFVSNEHITYTGILLLTQYLFEKYPEVLKFYQSYYPAIFVDEFQDTNWLQWEILNTIIRPPAEITPNQYICLFGDRIQRIYGFIGAIPDIFDQAQKKYEMRVEKLLTNHRFGSDTMMGKLEKVLRNNAENPRVPNLSNSVDISLTRLDDQAKEASYLTNQIQQLLKKDPDSTIAILVRAGIGSNNTKTIYNALQTAKIKFFYALFSDEDAEYINFHQLCLDEWSKLLKNRSLKSYRTAQIALNQFAETISNTETNDSLAKLLKYHLAKIQEDYGFLSFEEKAKIVTDTFINRALKQHLGLIRDSQVVFATMHGAKGLEWDYVLLPDLEKFAFPSYLCGSDDCKNYGCPIDWTERSPQFEVDFLDELSIFYVAITRAKKDIFLSYSAKSISKKGADYPTRLSCLAQLSGMTISQKAYNP